MIPHDTVQKLIPSLSEREKREMLSYYTVYEKYAEVFFEKAMKELRDHSVIGKLIDNIPKDISEERNKLSQRLQKDAIMNDNWHPYIKYQMEQGVFYAKMGLDFKSWYEVVALMRKYITPYLVHEYGSRAEFLSAFNGMNCFMDIGMGVIGEAYLHEKKEMIRQANELFSSIYNTTADILFVLEVETNGDYKFSTVNKSFLTTTGLPYEAVCGKYVNEVLPQPTLDLALTKYREAINENKIVRWEETSQYPTGTLTGEVAVAPVFDNEGNCIRLIGSVHDLTERKKAEVELQKTFKEISDYKFALDAFCIVAITNKKGIIQYANENFCKISKYSKEELIGKDHRIVNSGYHPKEFIRNLWATIANGKVWRGEIKNRAKDGTYYWVDTAIVPFLDEKGKPYEYVAIRSDITERKRADEEILKLNQELEQKVIARTAQFESINKEMEAFSYSVSHDLRAPLRAINGYARMFAEDYGPELDEEGRRVLKNIKYNSAKMGMLIDDLLTFSRLGRKEVQKRIIDMNELIRDVLNEMSRSVVHDAKVEIGKLHQVRADYGLLRQVMLNLLSNAVKYSSKNPDPVVEVFSEETNGEIVFAVKDNGAGFDMKYKNKLFGVFQRLHQEDEFEGTGVGLAIVQSIIGKHGGKVWAEGKVNAGAIFYFSLPNTK